MDKDDITPELRELLTMEVADIIATANEQGFATKDVLKGLAQAVTVSSRALAEDPDPADDPSELAAGPHSAPELIDPLKTPGSGALPENTQGDVDPGVG